MNVQPSASTGVSPFFANYRFHHKVQLAALEEPPRDRDEELADNINKHMAVYAKCCKVRC